MFEPYSLLCLSKTTRMLSIRPSIERMFWFWIPTIFKLKKDFIISQLVCFSIRILLPCSWLCARKIQNLCTPKWFCIRLCVMIQRIKSVSAIVVETKNVLAKIVFHIMPTRLRLIADRFIIFIMSSSVITSHHCHRTWSLLHYNVCTDLPDSSEFSNHTTNFVFSIFHPDKSDKLVFT